MNTKLCAIIIYIYIYIYIYFFFLYIVPDAPLILNYSYSRQVKSININFEETVLLRHHYKYIIVLCRTSLSNCRISSSFLMDLMALQYPTLSLLWTHPQANSVVR